MSWAFNIPFVVERGESMKTVKAVAAVTIAGDSAIRAAFGNSLEAMKMYVCISTASGSFPAYQAQCFATDANGAPRGTMLRVNGYATDNDFAKLTGGYSLKISVGDTFAVIDIPW